MATKKTRVRRRVTEQPTPGQTARAGRQQLRSYAVGALPMVNHLLERLQLDRFLYEHVRRDGPRTQGPAHTKCLFL